MIYYSKAINIQGNMGNIWPVVPSFPHSMGFKKAHKPSGLGWLYRRLVGELLVSSCQTEDLEGESS